MSQLAIKRNKIAREISRYEKLTYFKSRRNELLASFEDDHEDYDYTSPETTWLKQISDRSLRDNELKHDIQQHSLLTTLKHIALSTIRGRDIEIIQVILSNTLLDNISLDTKEEIVKLCLACFELKVFDEYSFNNKNSDLSIMKTIVHTMNSLAVTMDKVDQELSVKCQKLITRQLIKCLWQIKDCLKNAKKEDQMQMLHIFSLFSSTIIKLIFRQREYYNQSYLIFQRNLSSFYQILQLHANIVFNNQFNNMVRKIHMQMLQIELYLTEVFTHQNFQIYFQSKQFISIIIKEIYENRDEELNRYSLKIFFNLLKQYEDNQILVLLSLIESNIHFQDRSAFFTRLLYKDALFKQRMQLIQYFIKSNEVYSLIQPYFQTHWKDIFDECFYSIKEMSSNESIELALSILYFSRYRFSSSFQYLHYLKIIGLQGLLEYIFTTYDVNCKMELEFEIREVTRQKVGKMLQFLEEQ